jgi:hypothetical protein
MTTGETMLSPTTNATTPNRYNLLHLLQETRSDGGIVQYFVCSECLELVEEQANSTGAHNCLDKGASMTPLKRAILRR